MRKALRAPACPLRDPTFCPYLSAPHSNLQAAIQKACLEPSFHVNVRSWLHKHQSLGTIDVKPNVFHVVEARRTCLVTVHWQGWTAVSMYWSSEAGVKLWNLSLCVCVCLDFFFSPAAVELAAIDYSSWKAHLAAIPGTLATRVSRLHARKIVFVRCSRISPAQGSLSGPDMDTPKVRAHERGKNSSVERGG